MIAILCSLNWFSGTCFHVNKHRMRQQYHLLYTFQLYFFILSFFQFPTEKTHFFGSAITILHSRLQVCQRQAQKPIWKVKGKQSRCADECILYTLHAQRLLEGWMCLVGCRGCKFFPLMKDSPNRAAYSFLYLQVTWTFSEMIFFLKLYCKIFMIRSKICWLCTQLSMQSDNGYVNCCIIFLLLLGSLSDSQDTILG